MGNKDDRPALLQHLVEGGMTLELKPRVTHRQGLVDDEDVRVDVYADGEREPEGHAARVGMDGLVDELLDAGIGDDGVKLCGDLGGGEAEDGGVEVDVFAAGEVGVEAAAEFEEGGDPAVDLHSALGGAEGARDHLEEGALAGAVASDDADALAPGDVEGDGMHRGERPSGGLGGGPPNHPPQQRKELRRRVVPHDVGLADPREGNRWLRKGGEGRRGRQRGGEKREKRKAESGKRRAEGGEQRAEGRGRRRN